MIYKFSYNNAQLEFNRNRGRAVVTAGNPTVAVGLVRDMFKFIRDEAVTDLGGGRYQVDFKVTLDYRLPLLRSIERTVKLISGPKLYSHARYIDQYIVASIARETGKPDWIPAESLKAEISALRKAAVVAREVPNLMRFVDWDICIFNYIELNSKDGYRSRVIRKTIAADPDESVVDLA
jgi:hypothetical protein